MSLQRASNEVTIEVGQLQELLAFGSETRHVRVVQGPDPRARIVGVSFANGKVTLIYDHEVQEPDFQEVGSLTDDEFEALELTRQLAVVCQRIVGSGPTARSDLAELLAHIHAVQSTVMAQAAARDYPNEFRLLGDGPP